MPPRGKQGNLEKKLDEYLGLRNSLTNQEKIQKTGDVLMRAVYQHIEKCGDNLSAEEVKALKEAAKKFVRSRNEILARRFMQALDKERWDMLRIELVTFSRVQKEHLERMGIEILPPHPSQLILGRVDRLDRMYRLNVDLPSATLLENFIDLNYPIRVRIKPSELTAKHKIMSYFDLLDSSFPTSENCWVMLTELPLYDLSSTSLPSEVKATVEGSTSMPIERSTFLTGRADMAIIALAGKKKPIIQGREMKGELIESVQGSLTYESLFDRVNLLKLSSDDDEEYLRVESLQFLVMEAKANQQNIGTTSGSDGEVGTLDENEEEGSEGGPGRSVVDSDDDPGLLEVNAEGQDSDEGQGQENSGGWGGEGGEEGGEGDGEGREGTNDREYEDEGVSNKNDEDPLRSVTVLDGFLPQIVSECVALRSGPFPDKIIKFVLSDGDNWIFGLADCVKGKGGRLCHRATISVNPKDSGRNRPRLEAGILEILKFFAFWTIVPGTQLKKLFLNKQEDE